jgi:hypothetical protein
MFDVLDDSRWRTMRCNGAAVETFLAMMSQLPPPADRGRSPTQMKTLRRNAFTAAANTSGG